MLLHKLVVFISSTADLKAHRDAVERALKGLEIDGSRFEAWPPSPNADGGMAECLRQLDETDAVILLLGPSYGTIVEDGLSATHMEYRHALATKKPVFAFILNAEVREPAQVQFVDEVQGKQFRGSVIQTIPELEQTVRNALLQEYTRCFKKVHGGPPAANGQFAPPVRTPPAQHLFLSDDPTTAFEYLNELYESGQDASIQQLAPQIALKFDGNPMIMNVMYMAEVNLGMRGATVDTARIEQAVQFWSDPKLRKITSDYSLAYCQGNALGVLKRHHEAIARYEYALSKEPRFAPCWKNLGTAYLDIGDRAAATRCFLKAIEYAPDLFEARYSLATLAGEDGEHRAAINHLDRIALPSLAPVQQAWVLGKKAKSHGALGEYDQALPLIEAAITLDPTAEWTWLWAGRLHAIARRADKRWNEAARIFGERLVSRFPASAEVWAELGYTYWQLRVGESTDQLSRQCERAFKKALELGFSDNGLIHDRLGHLAMDVGDYPAAEAAFRAAVSADAASFGYCLGTCLARQEKFVDALECLAAAAESHQPDALSWGQVGFCHSKLGDMPQAIAAYEKAIDRDPDYAHAWFQLGGMLWNDKQRAKAITVWTEALRRFPDDPLAADVRRLLGVDES